jgi:isopenicillin N synthase-like dioxygenase
VTVNISLICIIASPEHSDGGDLTRRTHNIIVMAEGPKATAVAIPTIRLDDPDAGSHLRSACSEVGFFYLEGHGLTTEEIDNVFEESKKFFRLSNAEKEALSDKVMSRGYTSMQEETLDPSVQTEGDTKEGYYIGRDVPKDHSKYDPSKLRGPNVWPGAELVSVRDFRPTMEAYHGKASAIGFRLVQLLALSLGLEESHFDKDFQEPVATLRLLHYDRRESKPSEGILACGAHSDYGVLTLLLTDRNPGLQIYHRGEWIDVPPKPHSFVVNIGGKLPTVV